jgi:hypothetical protein
MKILQQSISEESHSFELAFFAKKQSRKQSDARRVGVI